MIPLTALPHPVARGDSRTSRMISRASTAEAVVGRVSALVVSAAHSRLGSGDRTPRRSLAVVLTLAFASMGRLVAWAL
ncbi:MAG TPA: hypothetical protein VFN38_06425, partial [Gemmatimonadaceae bacterium]|nr:hypothetical protein [Gemmatimonadaceae bacterium]